MRTACSTGWQNGAATRAAAKRSAGALSGLRMVRSRYRPQAIWSNHFESGPLAQAIAARIAPASTQPRPQSVAPDICPRLTIRLRLGPRGLREKARIDYFVARR